MPPKFQYKKEIDDYRVSLGYGGSQLDGGQFTVQLFSADEYVAALVFRPSDSSEIESEYDNNKVAKLYTPMSHFAATMDLLRNERPVFFVLYDGPLVGTLQTGAEPVGEEELGRVVGM